MFDTVAMLDRAPEPVRRLAYRVAAGQGMLGRIVDAARYRYSERDVPSLPALGDVDVRLLIGPTNSAGQGHEWARAAERYLPGVEAIALQRTVADPFQPAADVRVPVAVYQRSASWHAALEMFLSHQTHIIWESGSALLGRRYGSDAARELAMFGTRGVRGALMFHGSDIRPPLRHAEEHPWSPFRDAAGPVRSLVEMASSNAELAATAGVPVFVSTPDLLRWLPSATWCPVVVETAKWKAVDPPEPRTGPPVVAHAPSQRWLKGTDRIEPMLRGLAAEGIIDYREVVGVPHAAMPAFYADADIVLDQFLLGSYGVTACEAMAAGALVMGHVDDAARAEVLDRTGMALPVHEATVESLEAELRRAAADPEAFAATRAAGPEFVEAAHDGRRSAAALAPFLGVSA